MPFFVYVPPPWAIKERVIRYVRRSNVHLRILSSSPMPHLTVVRRSHCSITCYFYGLPRSTVDIINLTKVIGRIGRIDSFHMCMQILLHLSLVPVILCLLERWSATCGLPCFFMLLKENISNLYEQIRHFKKNYYEYMQKMCNRLIGPW